MATHRRDRFLLIPSRRLQGRPKGLSVRSICFYQLREKEGGSRTAAWMLVHTVVVLVERNGGETPKECFPGLPFSKYLSMLFGGSTLCYDSATFTGIKRTLLTLQSILIDSKNNIYLIVCRERPQSCSVKPDGAERRKCHELPQDSRT